MRQVDPKVIQERKSKILQAVIHHYIKTARPVGSGVLTDEYRFDLSPATIRSLMAELEEEGFLTHPHTSAGRIPTDKGYRTYVDSLMELQGLVIEEEDRVRQEYDSRLKEMEEVLRRTTHVLSALSQYSGFVLMPKVEHNQLQYIELIPLSENRILAVLVTQTGMVKHRIVEASLSRERLQELNRFLNVKLRGLSLAEAKQHIIDAIEESQRQEREMLLFARGIASDIFSLDESIYIDGTANVLTLPEFQDFGPVRSLLRLNDDKEMLVQMLNGRLDEDGIRVVIGSEAHREELKDLSVVSSVYKDGDSPVGVLGIIGPKRMEYPKMMALVGAVSKMVNKLLKKF